jgi:hypothetical protein
MKNEINHGLVLIIAVFLALISTACSNTKYVLHSKLPSQASTETVKFGSNSFRMPTKVGYGTHFNTNGLTGWLDITNKMLFDTNVGKFYRNTERPFEIFVSMRYSDMPRVASIAGISGRLTLNNGHTILPMTIWYGINDNCDGGNLNITKSLATNHTLEIFTSYKKSCFIFRYSDFVSAENEFTLYIGDVEVSNAKYKLDFDFIPVIVKTSTH